MNAILKSIILVLILAFSTAQAADPMWTWVTGSDACNPSGITNMPGGREQAVSWQDSNGSLWMFGGFGVAINSTTQGLLNGLWKFNGAGWTLIKGPDTENKFGVYGVRTVAASLNIPGSRYSGMGWIDSSDNLWLFGGTGYDSDNSYGMMNDLWKFNGINWIWMKGSNHISQFGTYGEKGDSGDGSNTPGARITGATVADDDTFWMFGGFGLAANGKAGALNDLWKFEGSKWTWVSGSNVINQKGIYGSQGEANPDNIPGARFGSAMWIDEQGNIWIYGGKGYDSRGAGGFLSDLWKFDGTNWTWVYGPNLVNRHPRGIYGTKGFPTSDTVPGDREAAFYWRDDFGFLWLFGGSGRDSTGAMGLLNDLWKFNGSVWEWVSGSDIADINGSYGTQGVGNTDNTPGARGFGNAWINNDTGNMWLFGGFGLDRLARGGHLNDLWKFGNIIPEGVQLRVFDEADEIFSQQSTVDIGSAAERIDGPSKVFTIRNNGSETLTVETPFPDLEHFEITQPEVTELLPGDSTTFTITLNTIEAGTFEEVFYFENNDADNNAFEFTVEGTVVPWEFGNIPGQTKNIKFSVNDVTFALTGGGYGVIEGDESFSQINLINTTPRSQFTITTKSKAETTVGNIDADGPLKGISAKTTNLNGNITLPDVCSISSIIFNDVEDGHIISIGSSSNSKAAVSMTFNEVTNLVIFSGTPIKTIKTVEWNGGLITAPSIGNIKAKGNTSFNGNLFVNAILDNSAGNIKAAGIFSGVWECSYIKSVTANEIEEATFNLDQEPESKVLALGKLTVKNHMTDCQIISDGNIGTVSAGSIFGSSCFAGIRAGVTGLPNPATDINNFATIKSFTVRGLVDEPNSFINSNVAATSITSVFTTKPQTENIGIQFGVTANFIKTAKIKFPSGLFPYKDPQENIEFGDFIIQLY